MLIVVFLIWTALVWGIYALAQGIAGFVIPGADWLEANPEIAVWVTPAAGLLGALGLAGAVIIWLIGLALIGVVSLVWRRAGRTDGYRERFRRYRPDDDEYGYEAPRSRNRRWRGDDDDDDDDDDDRRSRRSYSRRRRRDDDDDDDD